MAHGRSAHAEIFDPLRTSRPAYSNVRSEGEAALEADATPRTRRTWSGTVDWTYEATGMCITRVDVFSSARACAGSACARASRVARASAVYSPSCSPAFPHAAAFTAGSRWKGSNSGATSPKK